MNRPPLKALTGIRFFAAMAVLVFHFSLSFPTGLPAYFRNPAGYGYVGVSLFFVLSGFVLGYNYLHKPVDRQRFWIARFARIYPAYFAALVLAIPTYVLHLQGTNPLAIFQTGLRVLSEATLTHAWTPWTACGINCPGWSISAEAFFYLVFPFATVYVAKLSSREVVRSIGLLWIAAVTVPIIYLVLKPGPRDRDDDLVFNIVAYNPLLNLPQFLIGVLTGHLFLRKCQSAVEDSILKSRSFVPAAVAAVGVYILFSATSKVPETLLRNGLMAPFFALIIYALAHGRGFIAKFLSLPFMIVLGEASYAIYILETPLNRLMRLASVAGWLPKYGTTAYGLIFVVTLIGAAVCSFYFLETPARRLLTRQLHKYAERKSSPRAMWLTE